MTDRIADLRQQAADEASGREQRLAEAMRLQDTHRVAPGPGDVAYGQSPCPRCGVRSGIGCAHRPAGETRNRLTSHEQRSIRP